MRGVVRIGVLLGLVTAAWAQGPVMFPWWDSPISRDLGLSEDQSRQIRVTVRESRPRLVQLRREVEAAELELRDTMNEPQVDGRKAEAAIDKVVTARAELTRTIARMSLKLRLVLTPSQWDELQKRALRRPFGPREDRPMRGPHREAPPGL